MKLFKSKQRKLLWRLPGSAFCNRKTTTGFTLIELLVVVSIIAFLSSIVLATLNTARQKAQISKVRSDMEEFAKALEIYKLNYGYYPDSSSCVNSVCEDYMSNPGNIRETSFSSEIAKKLQDSKIYSGDLTKSISNLPDLYRYDIIYSNTPANLLNFDNNDFACEDSAQKFDNYLMTLSVRRTVYKPLDIGTAPSYWKRYFYITEPSNTSFWSFCSGN